MRLPSLDFESSASAIPPLRRGGRPGLGGRAGKARFYDTLRGLARRGVGLQGFGGLGWSAFDAGFLGRPGVGLRFGLHLLGSLPIEVR